MQSLFFVIRIFSQFLNSCWEKIYIEKKRDLETRVKEHFRTIKNGEIEKSAVAEHVWKEKHAMDHKPVLLKQ